MSSEWGAAKLKHFNNLPERARYLKAQKVPYTDLEGFKAQYLGRGHSRTHLNAEVMARHALLAAAYTGSVCRVTGGCEPDVDSHMQGEVVRVRAYSMPVLRVGQVIEAAYALSVDWLEVRTDVEPRNMRSCFNIEDLVVLDTKQEKRDGC